MRLPAATVDVLMRQLLDQRGTQLNVNLPNQVVTGPDGTIYSFAIEPLSKRRLLKGLDEIAHTQEYGAIIKQFEEDQKLSLPGSIHEGTANGLQLRHGSVGRRELVDRI